MRCGRDGLVMLVLDLAGAKIRASALRRGQCPSTRFVIRQERDDSHILTWDAVSDRRFYHKCCDFYGSQKSQHTLGIGTNLGLNHRITIEYIRRTTALLSPVGYIIKEYTCSDPVI